MPVLLKYNPVFPNCICKSSRWTLLLLSHFSCVQLCATPQMAAHQAPPSLGFFRQEHWSGLPFPSPKGGHYVRLNLSMLKNIKYKYPSGAAGSTGRIIFFLPFYHLNETIEIHGLFPLAVGFQKFF